MDAAALVAPQTEDAPEPDVKRLASLYLQPFGDAQRSLFVRRFAASGENAEGWRAEQFEAALRGFALRELLAEPLTLFMALSILPELQVRARRCALAALCGRRAERPCGPRWHPSRGCVCVRSRARGAWTRTRWC